METSLQNELRYREILANFSRSVAKMFIFSPGAWQIDNFIVKFSTKPLQIGEIFFAL
jgi:hypothetical protein